jgi:hypothetical protein
MNRKIKFLNFTATLFICSSCVSPMRYNSFPIEQQISEGKIKFKGGDGASIENAVIVKGGADYKEAILAEMYFISRIYGERNIDWKLISMATIKEKWSHYDVVEFISIKSDKKNYLYFDISAYFGSEDRYFN